MAELGICTKFLFVVGLNPSQNQGSYRIVKWLYLAVVIYISIPQTNFLITYRSDLLKVTECLPVYFENLALALKLFILILNVDTLHDLINSIAFYLNSDVNNVCATNKKIKTVYNFFGIIILLNWLVFAISPILLQFSMFLLGTATEEIYQEPFKNEYFFDNTVSGLYQLCYLIATIAMGSVSFGLVCVDCLYCAVCLYLMKFLRDVQDMLMKNNGIQFQNRFNVNAKMQDNIIRVHRLHNVVFSLHKKFQKCFSGVIFLQYLSSVFIICTCIFQSMMVENTLITLMTMCIFSTCALVQLLLYCWFGHNLTDEYTKIGQAAYNVDWYNYPVNIQKQFFLIIMRCHKPVLLKGLGFYNCDLSGFMNIINTSLSIVAVLQSLKG